MCMHICVYSGGLVCLSSPLHTLAPSASLASPTAPSLLELQPHADPSRLTLVTGEPSIGLCVGQVAVRGPVTSDQGDPGYLTQT